MGACLDGPSNPADKVGFIYMLRGDSGASNTDPYATEKKPDNHWIETGPHVMIVGPAVKQMQGYPRNPEIRTQVQAREKLIVTANVSWLYCLYLLVAGRKCDRKGRTSRFVR
jgi:hypothetical protein